MKQPTVIAPGSSTGPLTHLGIIATYVKAI